MAVINTKTMTLEEAKTKFAEVVNSMNWGMRFKKAPSALDAPPENFFVGFQSVDFPQEIITYIEERIGNFPLSWIGEVTRNGSISATSLVAENTESEEYLTRWINLMGKVEKGRTTHESVKTSEIEATIELFMLTTSGEKILVVDLLFCKPEPMPNFSGSNTPAALAGGITLKFDNFYKYLK
jgi:hypothetical protein